MPDRSWLCHSVPCHFNPFFCDWFACDNLAQCVWWRKCYISSFVTQLYYFSLDDTTFIKKTEQGHTSSPFSIPPRSSLSLSFYFRQYCTIFRHVNRSVRWWPISFLEELFELLRKWLWKIFELLYGLVVWKDVLLRVWKIPIIAFHWQAYPSRLPEWHDMIPWFIS